MNNWTKYIFKTVLDIGQRVVQQTRETLEKRNKQVEPHDSPIWWRFLAIWMRSDTQKSWQSPTFEETEVKAQGRQDS